MAWSAAAAAALLAVVLLWTVGHSQVATGTLVVVVSGRTATSLPATSVALRSSTDRSWLTVGSASGEVPSAPGVRQVIAASVPVGSYDAVRVGDVISPVSVKVTEGQVEPVLIGIDGGRLVGGAVYAGNDQLNLGLGELAGKYVPIQTFDLVDQRGAPFTPASIAGKDAVIAAFHTTCHETCPLYTALFLQLAKRLPTGVMLVEVTTDPGADTPDVLSGYARSVGANWTFATGATAAVESFWKQFGVELSSGDVHTSSLVLVDAHGYVRLVYRGVPAVGHDVPSALAGTLSAQGLQELAAGGDGWGAPDVLQALLTIGSGPQPAQARGGLAPDFDLRSTAGKTVSFSARAGKPVVINFWRSDCPPCRAEMPLLVEAVGARPGTQLLLVNYGEGGDVARSFLAGLGIAQPSLLDPDLAVARSFGVYALPTTVFVRSDGTIDYRQVGQLDESVLSAELSNLGSQ